MSFEKGQFRPSLHPLDVQEIIDLEKSKSVLLALPGSPLRDAKLLGIEFTLGKKGIISELHMDIDNLKADVKTYLDEIVRLKTLLISHGTEKTSLPDMFDCVRRCPFRSSSHTN